MKFWFLYIVFFIILTAMGCKGNRDNVEYVQCSSPIMFDGSSERLISDFVDNIEFIPLRCSVNEMLTDVTKLRVINDYYILSNKRQAKIGVYDPTGKNIFTIDSRGNGPGEYIEIAAFTATSKNIYILDNCSHKINVYSIDNGEFKESNSVDFNAYDMEALDDDNFLFANVPTGAESDLPEVGYKVWRTNRGWRITEKYLPYEDNFYEMAAKQYYFTRKSNTVIFHSFEDDGYYEFRDSIAPCFTFFEFASPVPDEIRDNFLKVQESGRQYLAATPYFVYDYMFCEIVNEGFLRNYLYSFFTKKFYINKKEDLRNGIFTVNGADENSFYTFIPDYSLYEILTNNGFNKASSEIEDFIKEEGACLIKIKMKNGN